MKVPKYIREKMHRIAKLTAAAVEEMESVEAWLENQGFDIESLRDGGGCSLEELEYGFDITDLICDRIEKEGNYEAD